MAQRNFLFNIGTVGTPTRARHFVGKAIVAVFHHVVDAHAFVAVVVVVGLPHGAVAVHGHFVVIAEIIAEYFHVFEVGIAAEHHALLVFFEVDGRTVLV